ncbi:interferon-induced very large GTPase 1-like isoform 2-T2 [Pholidichthys leucotaenia]
MSELTLVLTGDTNSIVFGRENLFVDDDEHKNEKFSTKLCDLFGRCIVVINSLGFQNVDKIPLNQGIDAILLLLTYGQHRDQYSSGVQYLQKAYGERIFSYVMTVVTYKLGEECESALTDLKANGNFADKRYHTCNRTLNDAEEVQGLLKKIDDMVSENESQGCRKLMRYEKQQLDGESHKEDRIGTEVETTADCKCVPFNEKAEAEYSEKEDNKSVPSEEKEGVFSVDLSGDNDKSVNNSAENNTNQKEIETLLNRLHLQYKHDQKLSPEDFLGIRPLLKESHEISEGDLAHAFLQRLMMLDYRARYILIKQDKADVSYSQSVSVLDGDDTDDNDLDDLFSTTEDFLESKLSHVHPLDVQMAIFHCSDNFLKQNMITKLSQCQYALPLLIPNPVTINDVECPLWALRQVKKTWKISEISANSKKITMRSMPICQAETHMIAFFRLGPLSLSKSQLMNALINERHDIFFHRNCPGSTKSRHLIDGLTEIAWYCPAGKPNDSFTDCIAFCNLHGDALLIEKQREILMKESSVNVVLVPTLKKSHESTKKIISVLYKFSKPLIILVADNNHGAIQKKDRKYIMGLKDRSQSDVSAELKQVIEKVLSGLKASFKLQSMDCGVSGIRVDDGDTVYKKGKSAAMKIVDLVRNRDISANKDHYLPCQGSFWHDWCVKKRELYHLKGDRIENDKTVINKELLKIREAQCKVSHSKLINLFTESLSDLESKERKYFLKWTQLLMDGLFMDEPSLILQNYDKMWCEVLDLKKKGKSDMLTEKQTELEQISEKLQCATFGLEQIFREMGQIYEAHEATKTQTSKIKWSEYPKLAADLIISGHPVELMDGDAGHVPLSWISSLLGAVIEKLGDKKVFVLSVLGAQSSGKSTMLNVMFGLQFAVSAGRCTKGAYMQLVQVSEEVKNDFKFDYFLVIDTEGLHALELAGKTSLHHDNELATFVVGLGNMTLINIFGENPAEMQDVLQIVVQAFMRMKKVKLSPSCMFVHQNVTDIAAVEKNMDGKRRLQEKLDQMTNLAAQEEECNFECFCDVIAFDVKQDAKYITQLWEGSPPMAPPNPGYSESIQELKNTILSKASQSDGITLSNFRSKVYDLWMALMNEHFVFSFRNTAEIAVYRKLEVQYGNWTWELRNNMLTVENQLYTEIENGDCIKVDDERLLKDLNKTYNKIKDDMASHFDDKKNKEILVQWQGRFENKIKDFHKEMIDNVKRKMNEVLQQKMACRKYDEKKTEFSNQLLQKSKELAEQLREKGNSSNQECKRQFDDFWHCWVKKLTADVQPIEDINLEKDQTKILEDKGFDLKMINERREKGEYKNISRVGNYTSYTHKFFNTFAWSLEHEEQQMIRLLIKDVENQSDVAIRKKPVATSGYNSVYLNEVASNVHQTLKNCQPNKKWTFKKEFTVDLLLHVFDITERWISESHKQFQMNNDAHTYLNSKKRESYNIFKSFYDRNSSIVVFGEIICEKLKVSIEKAVCNLTRIALAEELRCTTPAFNGNRSKLEKYVLKSLAEKENFDDFVTYIQDPRKFVEAFIEETVNSQMLRENKALNILKKKFEDTFKFVSQALFDATTEVTTQKGDIVIWGEKFFGLLKDKLILDNLSCESFTDIGDLDFLKQKIDEGLDSMKKKMSQLSVKQIKEFRLSPGKILINQLCDCCWEKCPFCSAVCICTIKDHAKDNDHSAQFHRSQAVNGVHFRSTVELSVDFCTTKVVSDGSFYPDSTSEVPHPYKKYRTAGARFATWDITPDNSKLKYWTWFLCQFKKKLEEHYKLKFEGRGEIPQEWRKHTKEEAIKSLDEMYKE